METHQPLDDQHQDPDDSVVQSVAEASFGFNNLQINANDDSNSHQLMPDSSETDTKFHLICEHETSIDYEMETDQHRDPDDSVDQLVAEISFGFNHLQVEANDASNLQQLMPDSSETDDDDDEEEEEEEEEEGDFTFTCVGDNDSPTTDVFEDGQIQTRQVFPLFDQSLLSGGDYEDGRCRLPIHVPVDNVFIESPRRSPSSMASGDEETDGIASATFCTLSKESDTGTSEINIKSNSTGFSKLWRFRDNMNRSNSDGRDAFVFLRNPDRTTTSSTPDAKVNAGNRSTTKVNAAGGSKAKKAKASAHEVYLKQRGGQTEEERRRSYLPYRPGLMGFFTNVNGGLSKNVHPF